MNRLALALFLFLAAVTAFAMADRPFQPVNHAVPSPMPAGTFRFAVFGDFRPAKADAPYPPQFTLVRDALSSEKPIFAVSTGDAYFGYGGTMAQFTEEVKGFIAATRTWDTPLFNVIGNHDVTGSAERETYLKRVYGNLYGSVDVGIAHFIFLDSDEVGREGKVAGEQLAWLERDLKVNRGAAAIFVFLHRPLFSVLDPDLRRRKSFSDRKNRDALHRLFVRFKVAGVFAGHEHLYDERVVDGVRYWITGGGGAPLYAPPDRGGIYHYLLVTVSGKKVVVELKRLQERP